MNDEHRQSRRPRFARWRTLRVRVTVIASLFLTGAILGGLLLLYLLQIQAVRRTLDGQLRAYALEIAQSAPTGDWPRELAPSALDPNAEAQVLDADGRVLAATRTLLGLPAVYALPTTAAPPVRLKAADGVIPDEIRVVGVHQTVAGRSVTVLAGTPTTLLTQLRSAFTYHLLLGLPIILLAAAAAVWFIVGRALRPVERIRQAVTDITSADLARRVPEPGTADEIGDLARTMNDMLRRLEDSARRQRRFVADASHELRSPLTAIRTALEVGLAHPDRAPWPAIAERAAQQTSRLEDLIQQLLLLAKADEPKAAVAAERVDLGKLFDDLRATIPAEPVTVELVVTDDAVTIGGAGQLERLFRNVVDNAVRYAAATVRITVGVSGRRVVVEVTDDGPGIAVGDRERIFDRFVRLDSSRDRGSGTTGLGLAIAREIATAHGGDITVADGPSRGSTFRIRLPRAPQPTRPRLAAADRPAGGVPAEEELP